MMAYVALAMREAAPAIVAGGEVFSVKLSISW